MNMYWLCRGTLILSASTLTRVSLRFMFQNPPDWQEILQHFRGSELQNYFTKILEDDLKVHVLIVDETFDFIEKLKQVLMAIIFNCK